MTGGEIRGLTASQRRQCLTYADAFGLPLSDWGFPAGGTMLHPSGWS